MKGGSFMANTEIFLRNIFGTTRPNIRPLVLALNITNDLLFEQHISMSDIKARISPYRLCSIFVRGTARQAFVGDKVAVSRCRQEVWDELEGGGTKYSNCIYYCLEAQSPLVGISFT